jgi:hypothetical protein
MLEEKTFLSATLSSTCPTQTGMGLNSELSALRLMTDHIIHGMAALSSYKTVSSVGKKV